MNISDRGIKFIQKHEGLSLKPYKDVAGYWTVGYGHLLKKNEKIRNISMYEAEDYLKGDLDLAVRTVDHFIQVALTQNEFDALVSFVYNIGKSAFIKSTLLKKLNFDDKHGAANEFKRWNRAGGKVVKGLQNRREAEKELFVNSKYGV